MNQHRTVLRWFAGLLMAAAITGVGMAPAQADTSWNGTVVSAQSSSVHMSGAHMRRPADTAWNGT
jgi:hypothetical protein